MSFTVYILQSETTGRFYIGVTKNIRRRTLQHQRGETASTKNKGPWKVIYSEAYEDKKTAWRREQTIKKYKGGEAFKRLIHGEVA